MYVCLCNGITDRKVRECGREGCCRVADVYRNCGCQPQCGKCIPMMRDILREVHAPTAQPASFVFGAAAKPSE